MKTVLYIQKAKEKQRRLWGRGWGSGGGEALGPIWWGGFGGLVSGDFSGTSFRVVTSSIVGCFRFGPNGNDNPDVAPAGLHC